MDSSPHDDDQDYDYGLAFRSAACSTLHGIKPLQRSLLARCHCRDCCGHECRASYPGLQSRTQPARQRVEHSCYQWRTYFLHRRRRADAVLSCQRVKISKGCIAFPVAFQTETLGEFRPCAVALPKRSSSGSSHTSTRASPLLAH